MTRERYRTGTGSRFERYRTGIGSRVEITESGSMTEKWRMIEQQQQRNRDNGDVHDEVADAVATELSVTDTEPHGRLLLLQLGQQTRRNSSGRCVVCCCIEFRLTE